MKWLKRIFLIAAITLFTLFLSAAIYYCAATSGVHLQPKKLELSQNHVYIYDGNCNLSPSANGSIHQTVTLSQVPKSTIDAFISTEDKRFYSHDGFDFKRIVKSALTNLKSGSFKQGASTISQQLIKNTHLSQEKTLKRKLQEWKLTRALERAYTKDEILEKYLNVIYFGHNCFGLDRAAKFYFNKAVDELSLADSAILAGLVKSPNHFSPFKNAQACKNRKKTVLRLMLNNGAITQDELDEALSVPLPMPSGEQSSGYDYARYVFDEFALLTDVLDLQVGGNIQIYTYLQEDVQQTLKRLYDAHTQTDKTFIVADTKSKGIIGCKSSVGDIPRLPGSLIKPLLVYAPAIEENMLSPATPILDEKTDFGGYAPSNYDGKFHGYVSARECLSKSLNVPAVKILESLGVKKATAYLEKMDLCVEPQDQTLALALGGMQKGFTLNDILSAYGTFQNGEYTPCAFIKKIVIEEQTVYERQNKTERVFSPETAYLTTDMLQTATKTGTAKKLRSLPFSIAAKTGTAGTANGNTDAYALGYTTKHLAAVWLGNKDNSLMQITGGGLPCNYLLDVFNGLDEKCRKENTPVFDFQKPPDVEKVALDKTSYYDTHTILLADDNAPASHVFYELFKKSTIPLNKSTLFSFPQINQPTLSLKNNRITITFPKNCPDFYEYEITRTCDDYASHTTLYKGGYIPSFTDEKVEAGKTYRYFVAPLYKDIRGQSCCLPSVFIEEQPSEQDKKIIQKKWWE